MPKKVDKSKPSKAPRGLGFSRKETADLLDRIGLVLPVGGLEWDYVYKEHTTKHADKNCSLFTIKQKFGRLHRTKVQTGTSLPDPLVRKAKAIQKAIVEKEELSDGEGPERAAMMMEQEDEDLLEVEAFEVEDPPVEGTAVAMATAPDDMDNVSTGSTSTDTEKHIRIIRSEIRRPDPSGTLVGVGITVPTPRVIQNDSEEDEKVNEDLVVDVSDEASKETEPKKKKATSTTKVPSSVKPFTGACARLGSRKQDGKKPSDAFGGTEMTAFLQYMMLQQVEETRARREEIKESRQQYCDMMLLLTKNLDGTTKQQPTAARVPTPILNNRIGWTLYLQLYSIHGAPNIL
jgi:hypothetical protein